MPMIRRRIVLFAAFALISILAVTPAAVAGKGKGKGTRAGGSTRATISFSPAQTTVGSQYRVNGSGFRANTWVTVGAYFSDTTWWNSQKTDAAGKFSLLFTATSAGQIYHEAKQQGNGGRLRLMTTATLTVTS
jgi:hypothetical protein